MNFLQLKSEQHQRSRSFDATSYHEEFRSETRLTTKGISFKKSSIQIDKTQISNSLSRSYEIEKNFKSNSNSFTSLFNKFKNKFSKNINNKNLNDFDSSLSSSPSDSCNDLQLNQIPLIQITLTDDKFEHTSNEISTLTSDYTTIENINLTKGQHIQIIQRLNNDFSLVQLLDNVNNNNQAQSNNRQNVEIQIPNSIIKSKHKVVNEDVNLDDEAKVAAAKRKGSFKKWLRSSHRKFTSQTKVTQSKLSEMDNIKIKKVLSNSEDLKIKNWLIEETHNDTEDNDDIDEQSNLEASSLYTSETNRVQTHQDEDQDDLINSTIIPPPMIMLKQEHTEQIPTKSLTSSFSKIPNQSIDIQRELKLWQSKMENNKKIGDNSSSDCKSDTQENRQVNMTETKLTYAINELLNTEVDYVNDLAILIEKYMEGLKRNEIPMPQDMEGGKDKIVFGNIQQIYEWHKSTFSPELEKCLTEESSYIGKLFVKYENRFQMYVKYCENKPKSEYIVSEYDAYFEELRIKLGQKLTIQDLLIKPVQRIMKYQLMLKEIKKYMDKEGKNCASIDRAIEIMVTVPKNADDMMNVGRLQGFEGRITAQGRLLLQDTLFVQEPDDPKQSKKSDKQTKLKERRVFLFQQIIIFSEMIGSNKKFTSPRYIFKCDMKVNKLQLQKDDTQMTFTLLDKTPESNRKIMCQCEDQAKYANWINHLQDLLDMQNKFLRDLQHPQLAMQKSGLGSPNQNTSQNSREQHSLTSTVNDFFKSTFAFASSGFQNRSSSSSSSASSPNPQNHNLSPRPTNLSKHSPHNNNNEDLNKINTDLNNLSCDAKNNSSIPSTAKVVNSYTAITEDEITLQKGDIVQIITANMHNRFLVHREANEHQPAAEGWIPGHVIGFQSTTLTN
ncbi:unnamed protein product [Brachionus calyciflorus]|uniref:Uncharacterized protein n=1 Tax=Brachionus calyciflorus TaxID=104777 RepID=A0A813V7S0_9BILA|nr:unnamed protein product [Brachionus calyciflorus]